MNRIELEAQAALKESISILMSLSREEKKELQQPEFVKQRIKESSRVDLTDEDIKLGIQIVNCKIKLLETAQICQEDPRLFCLGIVCVGLATATTLGPALIEDFAISVAKILAGGLIPQDIPDIPDISDSEIPLNGLGESILKFYSGRN